MRDVGKKSKLRFLFPIAALAACVGATALLPSPAQARWPFAEAPKSTGPQPVYYLAEEGGRKVYLPKEMVDKEKRDPGLATGGRAAPSKNAKKPSQAPKAAPPQQPVRAAAPAPTGKLERQVHEAVQHAKEKGFLQPTIKTCRAVGLPSKDVLALMFEESGMGQKNRNLFSGAEGPWQILEDSFLDMFARHGGEVLGLLQKIDAKAHAKMSRLVGLVKIEANMTSLTAKFKYDVAAYRRLLGKNAAKLSDDALRARLRQDILALRGAEHGVIPACFALHDLKKKMPQGEDYGVACLPRLIHNYGGSGGVRIVKSYLEDPNQAMHSVLDKVFLYDVANKERRRAHVERVMKQNGINPGETVGAFVERMEERWKIVTECLAFLKEKGFEVASANHPGMSGKGAQRRPTNG